MPRPSNCRRIASEPRCRYFKPQGVPLSSLDEVVLALDELEALRLADMEGLYQKAAAEKMGVSRPTFSRIVESARRKVAECLVTGKALKLAGGNVVAEGAGLRCGQCRHEWTVNNDLTEIACPECGGEPVHTKGGRCR